LATEMADYAFGSIRPSYELIAPDGQRADATHA
jgi:hypothetical protein